MLANIMFFGAPTDDPEDQFEVHNIRFSLAEVRTKLVTVEKKTKILRE